MQPSSTEGAWWLGSALASWARFPISEDSQMLQVLQVAGRVQGKVQDMKLRRTSGSEASSAPTLSFQPSCREVTRMHQITMIVQVNRTGCLSWQERSVAMGSK